MSKACRQIANHGQGKYILSRSNWVLTQDLTIQAAILQVKLDYLDSYIDDAGKRLSMMKSVLLLTGSLPPNGSPIVNTAFISTLYEWILRKEVITMLSAHDVGHNIYYPLPLQKQKAMASFPKRPCPNTSKICHEVLALPMHTELTNDQIEYIASIFEKVTYENYDSRNRLCWPRHRNLSSRNRNDVLCIDIDESKVARLKKGECPIYEPGLKPLLERNIEQGRLSFSTSLGGNKPRKMLLALPTPPGEDGSADLSYVLNVADEIGKI